MRDKIIGESYIISQNMKEKEKKINPIIPHLFERKKKDKNTKLFFKNIFLNLPTQKKIFFLLFPHDKKKRDNIFCFF